MEKPVVVLLSSEYAPELISQIPHAVFFPERATAYLGLLEVAPTVITVVPQALPDKVMAYLLKSFFAEGPGGKAQARLDVVVQPLGSHTSLTKSVLSDPGALTAALDRAGAADGCHIVNFAACEADLDLAKTLGGTLDEADIAIARCIGSKYGSKSLFDRADIAQPDWTSTVYNGPDGLLQGMTRLFCDHPSVCVKMNDASIGGGIGNFYFARPIGTTTLTVDTLEANLTSSLRPFDEFWQMVEELGCIVEEYLPEIISFPSALFHVRQSGCRMISRQEQIIENSHFAGFRITPDQEADRFMAACGSDVGTLLLAEGFQGTFGIDFARLPDDRLLALETNVRKTGVSHVIAFVDQVLKANGRSRDDGVHCLYRRGLFLENRPDLGFEFVMRVFDEINKASKIHPGDGVYLLNFSAIERNGFVEYCIVSRCQEDMKRLEKAVQQKLRSGALS